MKKILLILLLSTSVQADEGLVEVLVVSKMTGLCGAMNQQARFQTTTKMEGGDEFVDRFWSVEAARLGMSVPEFLAACTKVIKTYEAYYKALTTKQSNS